MRDFRPDVAGEIAAAWRDAAAWNDVAFAEYISGLRYPPHLRRLVRFARAHTPGASRRRSTRARSCARCLRGRTCPPAPSIPIATR